ncbi:MAG: hypothetical protein COV76_04880 [Candidatus Omnitrophica bacterium CG11_big_fil_rev_8_21_14_0_20_64_10]|nr:MAG: hypothetical protein COV76_04880 [Candidatus Omnitrophica bacterium CG11_big_fil_rev_8_21_14_0_20_64_10]
MWWSDLWSEAWKIALFAGVVGSLVWSMGTADANMMRPAVVSEELEIVGTIRQVKTDTPIPSLVLETGSDQVEQVDLDRDQTVILRAGSGVVPIDMLTPGQQVQVRAARQGDRSVAGSVRIIGPAFSFPPKPMTPGLP